MGIWAGIGDCTDPVVPVSESHIDAAEIRVRTVLRNRGIDPASEISDDGLALLRQLVVAYATEAAAREGAADADGQTVLWVKARSYGQTAMQLAGTLDRESLGLAAAGSGSAGYGSIPIGRA